MTGYIWTVTSGGTITAGAGTSTITVSWTGTGSQTLSVNYTSTNGCSAPAPTTYTVTLNTIPVPTISGNSDLCVNSGNYTYTTQAGMLNYQWTVTPGGFIVSGQGTHSLLVLWTTPGAQSVSVTYSSTAGCNPAAPAILPVTVKPKPGPAGTITGPALVCKPLDGVIYTTDTIADALNYVWSIPQGASISGASNTRTITVNYSSSAVSGNIVVYGTNACGTGLNSDPLHVVVHSNPPTPVITILGSDSLQSSASYGNSWYLNNSPIPGMNGQVCPITQPGIYYTLVTESGCTSDTSNKIEIIHVGVQPQHQIVFTIYPNPTDGRFIITTSSPVNSSFRLQIMNSVGQPVVPPETVTLGGSRNKTMDLGFLPRGMYWIILKIGEVRTIRQVILK